MNPDYLTLADLYAIHNVMIKRYGGGEGVRDAGALEAALYRPQTGYYPDIIHEAAALFESMVMNHPFVDGNKRTAFAACDLFFRMNGHHINASSQAIYDEMMTMLEQGTFTIENIAEWLNAITYQE